jgi:nucleoside-diphosphate-sugar epimerase
MKIFITGATGYIGGSVADLLLKAGHEIHGLARSAEKAELLKKRGITPIVGTLEDGALLASAAREADAVINAASSDHRGAAEILVNALAGSNKPLLHTSGSSIVGDKALGEFSPDFYHEDNRPMPEPEKVARVAIDQMVLESARRQVRSVVICPSLIYGLGRGLHAESVQLPSLINQARKSGVARHIGRGLNVWSNVHIDDVATLFQLALERSPAGAFYFAENGENSFREIVEAISRKLGLGGKAESWTVDEAVAEWGYELAVFALASNSRVRGLKSREVLGWKPAGVALLKAIAEHGF